MDLSQWSKHPSLGYRFEAGPIEEQDLQMGVFRYANQNEETGQQGQTYVVVSSSKARTSGGALV